MTKEYIQNGIIGCRNFLFCLWNKYRKFRYLDRLYANGTKWLNGNIFCNNNWRPMDK